MMYMIFYLILCYFIYSYNHILILLLNMETLMMYFFFMLMMYLFVNKMNFYMILYFMVMMVCEAVVGLSILVLMIRTEGDDYLSLINMNLW